MARKAKWPPVPREHKGRARVRFRGEDYYLGPFGSDEAAARLAALIPEWERLMAAPPPEAPRPLGPRAVTVEGAVAPWVEERLPTLDPRARYRYARALTVLVRVCGGMPAAEFEAGDLDRVRAAMLSGSWLRKAERSKKKDGHAGEAPNRGGPWSPATCNRAVIRIRTVWRWLELRKAVPRGSWGGLRTLPPLPVPAVERPAWSDADVIAVAAAMRKRTPCRLMLLAQLWSGCRSCEVRGMLRAEIDTSGPVWVWRPAKHKNAWRGHRRVIALGPNAQAAIAEARRLWPRQALVFACRGRWPGKGPPREYTASAYAYAVSRAAVRAGRPGLKPYDCRHLARERFSRAGGLEMARAALGHSGADMTARYGASQDVLLATQAALKAG